MLDRDFGSGGIGMSGLCAMFIHASRYRSLFLSSCEIRSQLDGWETIRERESSVSPSGVLHHHHAIPLPPVSTPLEGDDQG